VYLDRARDREMARSEWGKDVEYVVDWDSDVPEFRQNLLDSPPDLLAVLVKFVLSRGQELE
jgi:hypothetical protein